MTTRGKRIIDQLGDTDPLLPSGQGGPPDRREVSARWLSGTILTGLTSSILMGAALFAALDGQEQLATPPEIIALDKMGQQKSDGNVKTSRLITPQVAPRARDRRRMELSTLNTVGDRDLVRTQPFVHIKMGLAAPHPKFKDYPKFDPLIVFSQSDHTVSEEPTGTIYGAKVESDVSLHSTDFPLDNGVFDERADLSTREVEEVVRSTASILSEGAVQVAALHYIDPTRFGQLFPSQTVALPYNVKIVPENVSVFMQDKSPERSPRFHEEVITLTKKTATFDAFKENGFSGPDAQGMAQAISTLLNASQLKNGSIIRLGLENTDATSKIVRASIYRNATHIVSIALDDRNQYVPTRQPTTTASFEAVLKGKPVLAQPTQGELPLAYDGINRAALAYGLTPDLTKQLIRLLAADVEFQSPLHHDDQVEVFFSQPDKDNKATAQSRILAVKAQIGSMKRSYFRHVSSDGTIDYYDEDGKSVKQFLLRKPVPSGIFRSGFGPRRHPVLGYTRMHTGVDWKAKPGSPILAAGNGVVERSGWAGGYGRQTKIRHANGYVTSYNHQRKFAKGIRTGAKVHQGQVIGYVGTSGLSTGPHLHYELIVNGRKVDPMRVRLPSGKKLEGQDLVRFKSEVARINKLLKDDDLENPFELAKVE